MTDFALLRSMHAYFYDLDEKQLFHCCIYLSYASQKSGAVHLNQKLLLFLLPYSDACPSETDSPLRKGGVACVFLHNLIGCTKTGVAFLNGTSRRLTGGRKCQSKI